MIPDLEDQIKESCRFCNPPERERILYESANFYVMLSLGPIVEGYTLLVSKKHIGCCAEISVENFDEFIFLYERIMEILRKEYGGCIAYEHGKAGSCLIPSQGGKHCYHSHMHFVPVDIQLNKFVFSEHDRFVSCNTLYEFKDCHERERSPYLFVEDQARHVYPNVLEIRSQYLRYKTATLIGELNLWDWVKFQGWERINAAKIKLKPKFSF